MAIFPVSSDATQFVQILVIFGIILILYILFGVLFIVVSHLQERLRRKTECINCGWRYGDKAPLSSSWDLISPPCTADNAISDPNTTEAEHEGITIQLVLRTLAQPIVDTALSPLPPAKVP